MRRIAIAFLALLVFPLALACSEQTSEEQKGEPQDKEQPAVTSDPSVPPEQKPQDGAPAQANSEVPQEPANASSGTELPQTETAAEVGQNPRPDSPRDSEKTNRNPDQAQTCETEEAPARAYNLIDRDTFNRNAQVLDIPLFWRQVSNPEGAITPEDLSLVLFQTRVPPRFRESGKFTSEFDLVYDRIVQLGTGEPRMPEGLEAAEVTRRQLVLKEVNQGDPRIVYNNLRDLTPAEKSFVRHIYNAGAHIDALYALQIGAQTYANDVPDDDPTSAVAFRRNWGPRCKAPLTENNPACTAVPNIDKVKVDVYPLDLQDDPTFCDTLAKHEKAEELLNPFTVVRTEDSKLIAIPYSKYYEAPMSFVSQELFAAAEAMKDQGEEALVAYLLAAGRAFVDNNWGPADEAWAKMNAENSKWYLRIGPDEVYWEPCSRKAGFHVSFARINPDSLAWQTRLNPAQQDMEDSLAKLIGAPYTARKVTFHLPDFINIVFNCGDARSPLGATIGQSLPNWGPVANEGRGRTVVMSNLYTDKASMDKRRELARTVLDGQAMSSYPATSDASLLSIILHEATHNFGPSHEYLFEGKKDTDLFGGPLASTMEELKAQSGALWFLDLLKTRGIVDQKLVDESYVDAFLWALGHISRGMYTDTGKPKPYSQLAAIQVGFLMDEGAIEFLPETLADNGTDKGAFKLHLDRFPAAVNKLMEVAGKIKATGDKAQAEELIKKYVDSEKVPQAIVKERLLREPKATFLYSYDI